MLKKNLYIFGGSLLGIVLLGSSFYAGLTLGHEGYSREAFMKGFSNTASLGGPLQQSDDPGVTTDFSPFWNVWQILETNFTPSSTSTQKTVAREDELRGAITGLVQAYNDPYTVFLPKEKAQALAEQVNGSFGGIGAVLNQFNGGIAVLEVIKGSPAEHAGLRAGDTITSIDGNSALEMPLNVSVGKIRGLVGTNVTLLVTHAGGTPKPIVVTRGDVVIPTIASRVVSRAVGIAETVAAPVQNAISSFPDSLTGAATSAFVPAPKVKENSYYIIQLVSFSKTSVDTFVSELKKFTASGSKDLIIDLRNNPGGYIDVAVDLASYFIAKDEVVVHERFGKNATEQNHLSKGNVLLDLKNSDRKVAVLVNHESASASEILAGALQDYGLATIVGQQTYGKGSAQTVVDLGDVGSLKITIARWFTPKGRTISGVGITPDVVVNAADPKYATSSDPVLDAAIDALVKAHTQK